MQTQTDPTIAQMHRRVRSLELQDALNTAKIEAMTEHIESLTTIVMRLVDLGKTQLDVNDLLTRLR